MDEAQQLDNHLGKLVQIQRDGSAPKNNPFVITPEAMRKLGLLDIDIYQAQPLI